MTDFRLLRVCWRRWGFICNVWVSGFSLGLDGQAGHSVPCVGCFFFFFFTLWCWNMRKRSPFSVHTHACMCKGSCGMCSPSCHSDGAPPVIRLRCEMFPHRISLPSFVKGCDEEATTPPRRAKHRRVNRRHTSMETSTQQQLQSHLKHSALTRTDESHQCFIKALIRQQMCEEQKITHDWFSFLRITGSNLCVRTRILKAFRRLIQSN